MLADIANNRKITIKRETGALGAAVYGVDLSVEIDRDTEELIKNFLRDYLVIYFRDTKITSENHVKLSRIFGKDEPIPHLNSDETYPQIQFIRTSADPRNGYIVGEGWHADSTFLPSPPGGVVMRAKTLPDVGGDTLFANMYSVFESLSAPLQQVLRGLRGVHAARKVFGSQAVGYEETQVRKLPVSMGDAEVVHPVVCRHHVTGREFLFVNPVYTQRFEGMTAAESVGLLAHIYEQTALPQFQCRIRWELDQVLIWDNRAAQHRAVADYPGQARELERTTFGAPVPTQAKSA